MKKEGRFRAVRTALLESAQPDIPTAVAELEAAGCDRIVAVPLFVAPSGHTHFDVPAVLGIYSSSSTAATLAAEGAKAARPKVPLALTQTLAEGPVLSDYALEQVRKLSKSPKDEAVVLLAHGDPDHHLLIERRMRQIATRCCGEAGIGYADWAYIAVGQEYASQGIPAIRAALEHKKRVLVVGLYVSSSAQAIHRRAVATMSKREAGDDPFQGKDIVFSSEPILSQPDLLDWITKTSAAALPAEPATP
jgi:hypothetical protein